VGCTNCCDNRPCMVCCLNSCLLVIIEGWISLICNKWVLKFGLFLSLLFQILTVTINHISWKRPWLGSWPYMVCQVNFLLSILTPYVTNEFWNLAHAPQSSSSSTVIFSFVAVMKQIFGQLQILSKKETELWDLWLYKLCQYYYVLTYYPYCKDQQPRPPT